MGIGSRKRLLLSKKKEEEEKDWMMHVLCSFDGQ
jgi:hypothetical protein